MDAEKLATKLYEGSDGDDDLLIEAVSFVFVDYLDCGKNTVSKLLSFFGPELQQEFISSVGSFARANGLADFVQA